MLDFDFASWRREMEQAIARGEAIPIRVLLDQMQSAYDDARREADDASGFYQ